MTFMGLSVQGSKKLEMNNEKMPFLFQSKIQLDNIALHLIEDRPSPNITSPGSLPIDVAIPALTITRDKSGLFSIQPSGKMRHISYLVPFLSACGPYFWIHL